VSGGIGDAREVHVHDPPGALDLLKRTKQFALDSLECYRQLPQTQEAKTAGLQFLRASSSVGATYRAAKRGRSRAEFAARLGVVVEEADESVYWLEYMQEGHIACDCALLSEAKQLCAIFTAAYGTASGRYRRSLRR
jgi:four helix bundle protein